MKKRVDKNAPEAGENWKTVFEDIEKVIFDGSMHWQTAGNFGYFPSATSFPAHLGDMLCGAISTIGFTWVGIRYRNRL